MRGVGFAVFAAAVVGVFSALFGVEFGSTLSEMVFIAVSTALAIVVIVVGAYGVVQWMVDADVLAPP